MNMNLGSFHVKELENKPEFNAILLLGTMGNKMRKADYALADGQQATWTGCPNLVRSFNPKILNNFEFLHYFALNLFISKRVLALDRVSRRMARKSE